MIAVKSSLIMILLLGILVRALIHTGISHTWATC